MLAAAIPLRFTLAFAQNAAGAFVRTVPVGSQIGIQDGAASFNDGFVPDNFTALAGGGVPPFGQDFNGILKITTTWDQWYQAGGPIAFDATFSTAIGGYPKGAKVDSAIVAGAQWYSIVDANTTDPDDPLTSSGWTRVGIPVGAPMALFGTPPGFVAMNALTIGNAASGAGYASADSLFLFVRNWLDFSNTQCPILTSAGAASTRGANAVADFNANKRLTLPNGKGLGMIGVDTMAGSASTFLAGVPVTIGNTTTPGSILGESLHALSSGENALHTHANAPADSGHGHAATTLNGAVVLSNAGGAQEFTTGSRGQVAVTQGFSINTGFASIVANNASSGSGTAHNTVHRSMGVYWGQKL